MRVLLFAVVRVYWAVWPRHLNRGCIYRETCSHYIYRVSRETGFLAGCRALLQRFQTCRPGYAVTTEDGELGLMLRDGSFVPERFVAENTFAPIRQTLNEVEYRMTTNGNRYLSMTLTAESRSVKMEG
jgi:putative component of membrane protein insertase Oxa1/YidC/SpoIIIJ protein YidD